MVRLSDRLQAVADMVSPGLRVSDVGCDHGYLSIYLCENKIAKSVIASDVRVGPLSKAAENINAYELADQIDLRLSDGLDMIDAGEVDVIVMSGMGGNLMMDILKRGSDVISKASELILQPQSEIAGLRHYLKDAGFMIISESMVYEDYKYYPMMKAVKGEMNWDKEVYFIYGKVLLREQNPVLHQFLIQEEEYYVNLYRELGCQDPTERIIERMREVERALKYNNEALEIISQENAVQVLRELK